MTKPPLDAPDDPAGALAARLGRFAPRGPAPVEHWNPPFCGDIPLHIAADGTWHYQDSPIRRQALVQLFASILRREGDRHMLVTPVEKVGITVADAPFLAVEIGCEEDPAFPAPRLRLRTNLDDWTVLTRPDDLVFVPQADGSVKPYAHVRHGLLALCTRAVFYDLVARGETRSIAGIARFGVASADMFYEIGVDPTGEPS